MYDTAQKTPAPPALHERSVHRLSALVFLLFFVFGGVTSLNDVLIPKLKSLFDLTYAEAMLVQSAFFFAYFIVSIPAGLLISRLGYMQTAVIGLFTMAAGCLLFIPAAQAELFAAFLGALFVLAGGVTIVQVVANPLLLLLGPAKTAHSRVTFGHAFNSLGTTVAPYLGAIAILGALTDADPASALTPASDASLAQGAQVISTAYVCIAVALFLIAALVWQHRAKLPADTRPEPANPLSALGLLKLPRFSMGAACLFFYVGAEVALGSILVNFLMQDSTLGLSAATAGKHVAYYWGGAMVGRFIGAGVLKVFSPGRVLACAAVAVITLIAVAMLAHNAWAGWAILAVGLFNSIMFPTIFSLAAQGLGRRAAQGSGLLCCAIVGGAIVPPVMGLAADLSSLATALIVPALCYAAIGLYGWFMRRPEH